MLDASALIALLRGERGWEVVRAALDDGVEVSVLNLAEVLSKLAEAGQNPATALGDMQRDGLLASQDGDALIRVVPLVVEDALEAARLRPQTRSLGLSLADLVCLATAVRLNLPVLTADRRWTEIANAAISVRLIR